MMDLGREGKSVKEIACRFDVRPITVQTCLKAETSQKPRPGLLAKEVERHLYSLVPT
jgi:hypothetical protein